ncbi:MAG: glycosyltransferase family 39 protein, partial [Desulfobulbaceae bacterium]|nr:glycosyltransferase family 39 protein [Desulfobulbaceae bacterium]
MSSLSANTEVSSSAWDRRAYLLLATIFIWRLIFILTAPMDLVPDEAYYWDWSRHFALGYYSKPPFIAWVNLVSSALMPVSAFSVRLPAAIFATLSMLVFHALGRRLFSSRTAFLAVATMAASAGSCAIAYVMTIDAPLLFFWSVAVYCLWRAIEDEANGYHWWLASALAAGFGLLSKQMMLAYLVLMIIFLFTSKRDRRHLSSLRPYLVIILALAALLPPLWWNMQHDWITFKHTAHHFESNPHRFKT